MRSKTPHLTYSYVGPEHIRHACEGLPEGHVIRALPSLLQWLSEMHHQDPDAEGWATYTVGLDGLLRLAHRRTEHVACAGGHSVLAAGEVRFDEDGSVQWLSNNSTGYCPDVDCYDAVQQALATAGIDAPSAFHHAVVFRLCPKCRERSIVKEQVFHCGLCDAPLPLRWNFDRDPP